tara:strand:+ start:58 stop:678 length:621 start_codon:yes stop_codon:yes gene_type:complete
MSKQVKIILLIIVTAIISLSYFITSEHSISKINVDNFLELNEEKSNTIFCCGMTDFLTELDTNSSFCNDVVYFQPDFFLSSANQIVNSEKTKMNCGNLEFSYIVGNVDPYIQIINRNLDLFYNVTYNENIPYSFQVTDLNYQGNRIIKVYLNRLMELNEFTIRKSESKGRDLLIKETENSFIICVIAGQIKNPYSLWFMRYKKEKY